MAFQQLQVVLTVSFKIRVSFFPDRLDPGIQLSKLNPQARLVRWQQEITGKGLHRSRYLAGNTLPDHPEHILPRQPCRQQDAQEILSHHIHALSPVFMKSIRTDAVMLLGTERLGPEDLTRFKGILLHHLLTETMDGADI